MNGSLGIIVKVVVLWSGHGLSSGNLCGSALLRTMYIARAYALTFLNFRILVGLTNGNSYKLVQHELNSVLIKTKKEKRFNTGSLAQTYLNISYNFPGRSLSL